MPPIPDLALDPLFCFARVVEHGGFAGASRATGIPKSRLSRHVDALEQRLGLRLLQRSTRRFVVTELGREVYRHAAGMIAEAEAAHQAAEAARAEPRGLVRVACPVQIAAHMLAPVLPLFLQRHPQVRLNVEVVNRRVDVLGEGFDVALRVRERPSGEDGVVMRQFAELAVDLVASPGYLAEAAAIETPEQLAAHPALSSAREHERPAWTLVHADGRRVEVGITPRLYCENFQVLLAAAEAGQGIALLPESVSRQALASDRLRRVLPAWSLPQGIFHAVFPHRRGLLPAVRAFIDFLVETMPAQARTAVVLRTCPQSD